MRRYSFPSQCFAISNVPHRNSANYQPNFRSYDFLQSLEHDYADVRYEDRARKLQEEVRRMVKHGNGEIWDTLKLIDHVKRLGLSYHFHKEIAEALDRFLSLDRFNDTLIRRSLHEVALSFRLLREYGYDVSPDIFERFKDQNGNFKACLGRDVKGMLSLYEASFHGYGGEEILDDAKASTSFHVKNLFNEDRSTDHLEEVSHALEFPLHRTIQRLEARWYIEGLRHMEKERTQIGYCLKQPSWILTLCSQHTRRISNKCQGIAAATFIISSQIDEKRENWWKRMGLASKLSFSRDRLMECFFWTVGMAFEPQFSDVRKGLTKVNCLITTLDDVYDIYGTLDELEIFTAAVSSWDINAVQVLPEYMKLCFLALYNTINEFAYDTLKEQGQDTLPYLVKAWSDMLKAFLQEAKWCRDKHLPTFDDYLNNGLVSVAGVLMLIHAYFLLNGNITKETLDALHNHHDMLRNPSIILRLLNDLATSTAVLQRGEATSSIMCYMRENGASKEDAYKHIHSLLDENWMKLNKDRLTRSPFSKPFVEMAINLARISQFTYQHGDGLPQTAP